MGYTLDIPAIKPLDFSGLGELGTAMQNAREHREKQDNEDKKLSADMARSQWEMARQYEDDNHKRALEASQQLLPGSDLMRAAAVSAGLGNAVGKPYGIGIEQKDEGGAASLPPADAAPHPDASTAQFLLSGGTPKPTVSPDPDSLAGAGMQDPLLDAPTSPGNPLMGDVQPLQGPTPSGAPLNQTAASDAPAPEAAAQPDIEAATAARMPATTRHTYATVAGQRFEIPPAGKTEIFGEPKYDAMIDKLVAEGIPEKDAITQVAGVRKADIGEMGKNTRLGSVIGQKEATQLTREERMGMQDKALGVSTANSRGRDAAILGAAGIRANEGTGGGVQADPKALAALNARLTQIRGYTAWNKLNEAETQSDMLLHDIDSGATPLQGREAQVLAARIIRGRVTDSEMRQLYTNLGGASDAFNRLAYNQGLGQMTPEQKGQLASSVDVILNNHRMMVQRAKMVAKVGLDARTFPAMPGQAQAGYEMALEELGLPPEPLNPDAAPAPPVAPGPAPHGRHGRPTAVAPAAPAPQETDPIRIQAQKAIDDPNAPPAAKAAGHKILGR